MLRHIVRNGVWFLALFPSIYAQEADLADSYFHFSMAQMYDLSGDYALSMSEFEKALTLDPDSPWLYIEYSRTALRAGEGSRAEEACNKAIELDLCKSSA